MSALEVSVGENVETVDNFCAFKHIPTSMTISDDLIMLLAPVAQWIERWFPVPCAGVRFPSGVLPGTYVQFRCVVS